MRHFSQNTRNTLINIPYNLAWRLCTTVDERTTLEQRLNQLRDILRHQDYPEKIIENGIKKAKSIPQETLRKPTEKSTDKNTLIFVSTHNPLNPDIFQIIKRTLPMLDASPRMKQAITNKRIIQSKRQPPNLKEMLTRARFTMEETDSQPKIQRCKDTRCKTCHELQTGSKIRLGQKRERFEIKRKMNCSVRDLYMSSLAWDAEDNTLGNQETPWDTEPLYIDSKSCTHITENCTSVSISPYVRSRKTQCSRSVQYSNYTDQMNCSRKRKNNTLSTNTNQV